MEYLSKNTKVKIHPDSPYTNQGRINGKFIEGVITHVDKNAHWCYRVYWDDGTGNSYTTTDLISLTPEQDNYEIY